MTIDLGLTCPIHVFDMETLSNVTTCVVRSVNSTGPQRDRFFTNIPGLHEPFDALRRLIKEPALWVGFNNLSFDNAVMRAIVLDNVDDAATLKGVANRRIEHRGANGRQYPVRDFGQGELTLDLFALYKGTYGKVGGLKYVALKLDAPEHTEMPYPHDATLTTEAEMRTLLRYNRLDVDHTERMLRAVREMIEIRFALAETYDIPIQDILNASDSKLAEEVLKVFLFPEGKPTWTRATAWHIDGAAITDGFEFDSPELTALRDRISGWSLDYGASKVTKKDGSEERKVSRPHYKERFSFAGLTFVLGLGGLHSVDGPAILEGNDEWAAFDYDIRSFYPMMMKLFGWAPMHLNRDRFIDTLDKIIAQRLEAKDAGNVRLAQALKIALNSIFGKSKSAYSWLLDPTLTARVCLTGELIILQAVELLSALDGVSVLSVNTDGLMVRTRRGDAEAVWKTMQDFVACYGLEAERVEYAKVWRRDVSNYIALPMPTAKQLAEGVEPEPKCRGTYAYDKSNLEKAPTRRVVVDAVREYFVHGTPVEQTVNACADITDFIDYFAASKGYVLEDQHGNDVGGTMVRWYRSTDGVTLRKRKLEDVVEPSAQPGSSEPPRSLNGSAGNAGREVTKVSLADRVTVCQDLPAGIPANLDRTVYVEEALGLIADIENPKLRKAKSMQVAMEDMSEAQRLRFAANHDCAVPDMARCDAVDLARFHRMYAGPRARQSLGDDGPHRVVPVGQRQR